MKFILSLVLMCAGFISYTVCAADASSMVSFSFDQLYPITTTSRALNALRYAWSLAQDLNDNQYDADTVRHVWLDLYGACGQLLVQKNAERVLHDVTSPSLYVHDDVTQYIKSVWHMLGSAYDQIQLKDASLGQFLGHMRIACGQMIELL